jgi:hypothetical protein
MTIGPFLCWKLFQNIWLNLGYPVLVGSLVGSACNTCVAGVWGLTNGRFAYGLWKTWF